MTRLRARLVIVAIAAVHAAVFITYQRPDWDTQWTDQNGYMRLGHVLAGTGRFTRFPDAPQFVPEAIRTPGYPVFLAALDLAFGQGHLVIAVAQAVLFAAICLLVFAIGRTIANDAVAFAAGVATALYPPLPYFGALALTEVFTTLLVTLGMLLWLVGWQQRSTARLAVSGAIFAWAALTRPTFQYLPVFLIAAAWLSARRPERSARIRGGFAMLAAFVAVLTPWIAYNVVHFGMLTFTPAGGIGRVLFEGTWQVALPGRVETALTDMANKTGARESLDAKVRALAAQSERPAEPMLQYVHQWQDIRKIWTEPQNPWDRTLARIVADREYLRVGLANVREHPLRHLWGRATRGPVLLWASEIPIRYSDINSVPPLAVRTIWVIQLALMGVAAWGLMVLWRRGLRTETAALAALLLYITAVHVPLYTEARYSLPAKPVVLLLAVIAVADGFPRRLSRREPERSHEINSGAPGR